MTDYIVLSEVLYLRYPANLQLVKDDVVDLKKVGLDPGRIKNAVARGFVAEYTKEFKAERARVLDVETVASNIAKTETAKLKTARNKRRTAAQIKADKAAKKAALAAAPTK